MLGCIHSKQKSMSDLVYCSRITTDIGLIDIPDYIVKRKDLTLLTHSFLLDHRGLQSYSDILLWIFGKFDLFLDISIWNILSQILGTGMDTQDTSPSVLLFFDHQRFIFNAGEVREIGNSYNFLSFPQHWMCLFCRSWYLSSMTVLCRRWYSSFSFGAYDWDISYLRLWHDMSLFGLPQTDNSLAAKLLLLILWSWFLFPLSYLL